MEIKFEEFGKYFLRFLGKNPRYHGTVEVKFFNGKIANVRADDSFDIEGLRNSKLIVKETDMFIKTGASMDKEAKTGKILTEVEMSDNKIVKESKISKPKEEEKIETVKSE